jgi:ATP-dependent helicase HrpA
LTDSPTAAKQQSQAGLVRLFQLINRKSLNTQLKWLPELDRQIIALTKFIPAGELKSQLGDLMIRIAFVEREKPPRTNAQFDQLQSNAVERIGVAAQEIAKWLPKLTDSLLKAQLQIESIPKSFQALKSDLEFQLTNLMQPDLLALTPWIWLIHVPRYLEAMRYRIDKATSTEFRKDQESRDVIAKYWNAFERLREHQLKQGIVDPELTTFRWMIEEFRVSLFAQPLGTSVKVSAKRMEQQFAACAGGRLIPINAI